MGKCELWSIVLSNWDNSSSSIREPSLGDGWEPDVVSVGGITEGPGVGDVIGGVTEGPGGGVIGGVTEGTCGGEAIWGVIDGPGSSVISGCLGKGDTGVGVDTEGPGGGGTCWVLDEGSDEVLGKEGVGGSVEPWEGAESAEGWTFWLDSENSAENREELSGFLLAP